jgi:hypothetical protein
VTLPLDEQQQPPESGMEAGEPERAIAAREPEPEPQQEAERETEPRLVGVHAGAADLAGYHSRFEAVQSEFIDEPRQAVEKAASLVEEAVDLMMRALQRELEQVRSELGDDKDTERLRIALRRYRDVLESLDTGGKRPNT